MAKSLPLLRSKQRSTIRFILKKASVDSIQSLFDIRRLGSSRRTMQRWQSSLKGIKNPSFPRAICQASRTKRGSKRKRATFETTCMHARHIHAPLHVPPDNTEETSMPSRFKTRPTRQERAFLCGFRVIMPRRIHLILN